MTSLRWGMPARIHIKLSTCLALLWFACSALPRFASSAYLCFIFLICFFRFACYLVFCLTRFSFVLAIALFEFARLYSFCELIACSLNIDLLGFASPASSNYFNLLCSGFWYVRLDLVSLVPNHWHCIKKIFIRIN